MRLFKYEGYEVRVAPEALTLRPFKKLWDRDKTKDKEKATLELSLLYFFCDPRSDYQYITNEEDRLDAVKEGLGLPSDWKLDTQMRDAITFYKSFDSHAAMLMRLANQGVDKVQKAMEELQPTDTGDAKKAPITVVKEYLSVLKIIPEVASMLKDAEKALNEENDYGEAKGAVEKAMFDDGLDEVADWMDNQPK